MDLVIGIVKICNDDLINHFLDGWGLHWWQIDAIIAFLVHNICNNMCIRF